jgi:peptidoglycan/xylan/chitin deacetylase (PgdA/CDA1 family)
MNAAPILLYHSVSEDPPAWIAPFTVTPETFARHLDAVVDSGRPLMNVSQFVDWSRRAGPDDPAPVVVTFDDGYADFATAALPALTARGVPSTLYVTTGALRDSPVPGSRLEHADMLPFAQLRDLDLAGVEIGCHGHTHVQLDTVTEARVVEDVERSRDLLEDELGHRVPSFAYAHGYSSPVVRRVVRGAGFESACAVRNTFSSASDHPFALARQMVMAETGLDTIRGWLARDVDPPARFREGLETIGWRWVRRARATLTSVGATH